MAKRVLSLLLAALFAVAAVSCKPKATEPEGGGGGETTTPTATTE